MNSPDDETTDRAARNDSDVEADIVEADSIRDNASDDIDDASRQEAQWVDAIRTGDPEAWRELIDRFEGRLLAYAYRRIGDRDASEDVVQETLVGFLVSLPNYDRRRRLENYLFSICSYKLTDYLRKIGRRPTLPLIGRRGDDGSSSEISLPGRTRGASSIVRSAERVELEQSIVAETVGEQIEHWRTSGNYIKLKATELLFVVGRGNLEVAQQLGLSQQQVANFKSDFMTRVKANIARQNLDAGVFPELND